MEHWPCLTAPVLGHVGLLSEEDIHTRIVSDGIPLCLKQIIV